MPWYRPVSWALYDQAFELCFWRRSLPRLLFTADWSGERITFSLEMWPVEPP